MTGAGVRRVTIDVVTEDPTHDEAVLYLVDDGPWPADDAAWTARLRPIQDWLWDAIDAAVDGQLAARFPELRGKKVRLQIDSPSGCPARLQQFVDAFRRALAEDREHQDAIRGSEFVGGLRVLTGHELGRFR